MKNELIGAIFSEMEADTQAEFFNGFGRHVRLGGWSPTSVMLQMADILDHLDDDGKSIIRELAKVVGSEQEENERRANRRNAENTRIISDAEKELEKVNLERDALIARVSELEEKVTR